MNVKRISILILSIIIASIIFFISGITSPESNAEAKVFGGSPTRLLGKYWKIKTKGQKNQYFYVSKNYVNIKNTSRGSFSAGHAYYSKIDGWYVLSTDDPSNPNNGIWWFIKPYNSWKKIKFGYTILPVDKKPIYAPGYYGQKNGTRVSKVTAMLH